MFQFSNFPNFFALFNTISCGCCPKLCYILKACVKILAYKRPEQYKRSLTPHIRKNQQEYFMAIMFIFIKVQEH